MRITGASFLCCTKEDLSQTGLEWGPRLEIYNLRERVNEGNIIILFISLGSAK